jgi:hypothetical protein
MDRRHFMIVLAAAVVATAAIDIDNLLAAETAAEAHPTKAASAAATPPTMTSVDIGDTKPGKTVEVAAGTDFDVEGYGMMFSHHVSNDSGRFVHLRISGDFDMSVRIERIANDLSALAEAGLMVRKSLEPDSVFLGQFATCNDYKGEALDYTLVARMAPGAKFSDGAVKGRLNKIEGYEQMFDGKWEGVANKFALNCMYWSKTNDRPRPFPKVWTRLKRTGNKYEGFVRQDHPRNPWIRLGSLMFDFGERPYVGMAVIANHHGGNKDTRATVAFRDFQVITAAAP